MKNKPFLVSCFYTAQTPYKDILYSQLIPSLDKFNIKYNIEEVENKGSWLKNVAQKPLTILHTLEKYSEYNVVSIDVDAEVCSYPKLFDEIKEEFDLACHYLSWKEWYGHKEDNKELLTGSMWFNNTQKVREFVKEWYDRAIKDYKWEQKVLSDLILERKDINIYYLPVTYCWISTLPDGSPPKIQDKPVIQHFSASRQLKRKIRLL
ncbi:putative nucleotide-diphospho-sugar transferase [Candidatus Pacearchaeota archaeon]|nr:putative nucleotide-diphospho-sugar transferase [Candidatus Pacearchaeota archaeon]